MSAPSVAQQLFNPWDPPPAFASPPADDALVQRITKLADYAARNGSQFVELMRSKQSGNPEYAFLFGGEGSGYYTWYLYCTVHNMPPDQPLPDSAAAASEQPQPQQPVQPLHPYLPPHPSLPPEVDSGFTQVLQALNGSKDSIKASQSWFMACAAYAPALAEKMAQFCCHLHDYQRQLHLLYLANDILFNGLARRESGQGPESDAVALAFKPVLGSMLAAAYYTAQQSEEARGQLTKIVQFWGDRAVFTNAAVTELATAMYSPYTPPQPIQPPPEPAPAPVPAPGPAAAAAGAAAAPGVQPGAVQGPGMQVCTASCSMMHSAVPTCGHREPVGIGLD